MRRLFTGIECEGYHRGLPTLFVEGNVRLETIRHYLCPETQQVYLGAGDYKGDPSYHSVASAALLAELYPALVVTLETLIDEKSLTAVKAYKNFWLMLPILARNGKALPRSFIDRIIECDPAALDRVQLKILGDSVTLVARASQFIFNKRSEVQNDKTIWNAE